MNTKTLNFYTQFKDNLGHEHYAVHGYNHISGIVTMMKDLKFSDPDLESLKKEKSHQRFIVLKDKTEGTYRVSDLEKKATIATFYDFNDAKLFCFKKNSDEKYLDDMEDTPWS